tara:strand:+ start:2667 stop:3077 length:411 start_codon:yes stop_codon:yes gene_type:complete
MKTTEINGTEYKLTEGEGGKITLTPLIKQPEKRTPEAGDVWIAAMGKTTVIDSRDGYTYIEDGYHVTGLFANRDALKTYLGKFDEVYVKIADVRAALSHKDVDGDSILNYGTLGDVHRSGIEKTRAALRKLNIFTK